MKSCSGIDNTNIHTITIPLALAAIAFCMVTAINHFQPKEVTPVEVVPVTEPAVPEPAADTCDRASMMIMPDHATMSKVDYHERLYSYSGKRQLVLIPNKINSKQADLLVYAYEVAQVDGHTDPSVLQGLIWQESKAGGYPGYEVAGDEYGLNVGHRYYGVGQIKVAAAKDVFKRFPEEFPEFYQPRVREKQANGKMKTIVKATYLKTNDEIIAYLIMDKKFNIRVASKYLWMMGHKEKGKKTVFVRPTNYAITAYNRGLGPTYDSDYDNWHYTVSVHKHKDTFIKTFNLANNIAK